MIQMLESNLHNQSRTGLLIFFLCLASHALDASTLSDEEKVKAAFEEVAVLDVCPDRTLLELAQLETEDCRSHIAKIAPVCWHLIDGLVSDQKTKQDELRKERNLTIAALYARCVRSEILRQIVKSKREGGDP
jgi:hypothetical protein